MLETQKHLKTPCKTRAKTPYTQNHKPLNPCGREPPEDSTPQQDGSFQLALEDLNFSRVTLKAGVSVAGAVGLGYFGIRSVGKTDLMELESMPHIIQHTS